MTALLIKWALTAGIFMGAAALLPTVKVKGWGAAFFAALALGVVNVLLGWPLSWLAGVVLWLPNLFTFGLVGLAVSLVINTALLVLVDKEIEDLEIKSLPANVGIAGAISVAMGLV
ncbi:MAG: phage holin family protein [Myxococcales bacterium]|nr:phage holin family protein [Myxococcales bacterium]